MPCMHCFQPFPTALTPVMLWRKCCTQWLHGVSHSSLAYVCTFVLEPNCLSDLCYPKEDLELMAINFFFREDQSHGRGKKTRKKEPREFFSFHIPAGLGWSWLQLCWWSPAQRALLRLPQILPVPEMCSQAKWEADGPNAAPPACAAGTVLEKGIVFINQEILLEGEGFLWALAARREWQSPQRAVSHSSRETLSRSGLSH